MAGSITSVKLSNVSSILVTLSLQPAIRSAVANCSSGRLAPYHALASGGVSGWRKSRARSRRAGEEKWPLGLDISFYGVDSPSPQPFATHPRGHRGGSLRERERVHPLPEGEGRVPLASARGA